MNAATEQFRNGRYEDSLKTLRQAIGRNKQYAAQMPGKISDLYATHADVASHYGTVSAYQSSTRSSSNILRKHLGTTHPATLASRSQVGDMLLASGMPELADQVYREAAQDAISSGQPKLAAYATFRRAWLSFSEERDAQAENLLKQISSSQVNDAEVAQLVQVLRLRMALRKNDDKAVERLRSNWPSSPSAKLYILSQPPMPSMDPMAGRAIRQGSNATGAGQDVSWMDVGYWVRPNGATDQVEVLRSSQDASWAQPILNVIAKRRYAPFLLEPGSPGLYQINRYSLRRDFGSTTGSRIVGRYGAVRVVVADLTSWERNGPNAN